MLDDRLISLFFRFVEFGIEDHFVRKLQLLGLMPDIKFRRTADIGMGIEDVSQKCGASSGKADDKQWLWLTDSAHN